MLLFSLKLDLEVLNSSTIIKLLFSALFLGLILSVVYYFSRRKTIYDRSFASTLLLLPIIVSFIITLISDNWARAFSLAGVFTLVRFRTAISDSRDITYILSALGIGLAISLGYLDYAIIITVFVSIIFIVLSLLNFDTKTTNFSRLKIVIPESLNYTDAFNSVFEQYLTNYHLHRVKTTDFGTMFELTYFIKQKDENKQKEFIDSLRVINSNLNIAITRDYISMENTSI